MFTILFTRGCRSDAGLSAPIIKRCIAALDEECNPIFDVKILELEPQCFGISYARTEDYFTVRGKPDLIFITGDRVEQCAAAACAFHNGVRIAHMYGGVINDPITTYDDIDRGVISLWADIHFVESLQCGYNVAEVTRTYISDMSINPIRELASKNIFVCGCTHLDDLEIDELCVPSDYIFQHGSANIPVNKKEYDLILYNTPTKTDYSKDIAQIRELIEGSYSVLVSGNPDGEAELELVEYVDEVHIDLSRAQFLGLLKNCSRFISNSSCTIYEAPYFLKPEQIIHIGERNKNRSKVVCKPGGSDKVVEVLKGFLCH
jgi:UDP-N-acetylglucosamine 2-epimerase